MLLQFKINKVIIYYYKMYLTICHFFSEILMAKAAIYLVEHAPSNTIWLCERDEVLYKVELQQLHEFSIKFEPKVSIYIII